MSIRGTVQRRALSVLLAAVLTSGVAAALAPPAFAGPNTIWVSTGGLDVPSCGVTATFTCQTIQYAVNQAASGDIVRVEDGMYPESVSLSQPITLTNGLTHGTGTITGGVGIADGTDNVTIDGLDFGGAQSAISAGPTNDLTLTDNTFALTGSTGAAITLAVPDQADVLNATLGGNSGTVAAGMQTIAESGDGAISVTPTATPNTITSATASLTVNAPSSVHTGADATPFTAAADTGGLVVPAAQYDVRITGTTGAPANDLHLKYDDAEVPLAGTAASGNAITGSFGAFPPNGLDSAPELSLAADVGAPAGTLHVATTLDEVAAQSGDAVLNTIASTTNDIAISTNQAPVANDYDAGTISALHPTNIDLGTQASDGDSDPLTYSVVSAGAKGTVTFSGSTATYTPTGTPTGTDTFTYKVNDGTDDSNTATVTVTFNDAPTAADDSVTVADTHSTDIDLASKTSDGDSDPLTYSVVSAGAKGTVTFSGSTATYTPTGTPTGTDTFTYKVTDGTDFSNTATVTVTFNKVPAASADAAKVSPLHPTDTDLATEASDEDGDQLTYSVVTDGTKGTATFNGSTATYTPTGHRPEPTPSPTRSPTAPTSPTPPPSPSPSTRCPPPVPTPPRSHRHTPPTSTWQRTPATATATH